MSHVGLISYYEDIFSLLQYHKWSVFEIESLLPWEFDIYRALLSNYLEAQELEYAQAANKR